MNKQQNLIAQKKEELQQLASNYKNALAVDVEEIREKSTEIGKHALIIGGILLGGYLLSQIFGSKKKKEAIERSSVRSDISRSILKQIALFLLGIARQKLMQFLKEKNIFNTSESSVEENHAAETITD